MNNNASFDERLRSEVPPLSPQTTPTSPSIAFQRKQKNNFAFFVLLFLRFSSISIAGELEVTRARNVILNATLIKKQHERDNGDVGLLVVTNFKLSFITQQNIKVKFSTNRSTSILSTKQFRISFAEHIAPRQSVSRSE